QGDFVAVLLENSYRVPQIIYALQYLGAVTVLLNIRLAAPELAWQIQDANCKLLVYDAGLSDTVETIKSGKAGMKALLYDDLIALPTADALLPQNLDLEAVHTILYTSGTTGRPKGVMLTNGNHWWSAMGSVLNLGLHIEDKWLICVPLFHMSGLSIIIRSVIYGIPVIIQPKFLPQAVNQSIQKEGVTIVSVVSSMLARMLEQLGNNRYPDAFRCMLTGGGPVPESLLQQCRKKRIPVYQTYGLTETASQIATLSPEYMDSKLGSAGKPLFPSELLIMDEHGCKMPGEVGEIVVRGPNVTNGYLHSKKEKTTAFQAGWFHTGDLGYTDAEGFLYVLDRRKDLIISGGENIYPAEVEAVLLSYPPVLEAGVVGCEDEKWGQVPVAFVVAAGDVEITEEAMRTFCRERLAHYKCPARIYFVEQLPRNAANKLLRRKLAEWLSERGGTL
ncbi:MAG: o-succinylbenzoate--CoA ligase, partial [Firmicutes bacterium]|nr:o-succinylbenzoate--CoA ligase [Bacillota bacterium]